MQNQPNQKITPELQGEEAPVENSEQKTDSPENIQVPAVESVPEKPVMSETPRTEQFADQQTQTPQQPVQAPASKPQDVPVSEPQSPNLEEQEAEATVSGSDKQWVAAVDTVIEKDKDKPFEEEEDSEKLQVDYLKKRFGKEIQKDN